MLKLRNNRYKCKKEIQYYNVPDTGYQIPGAGLIILELKLKFHTFYSLGYVIKKPRGS